MSKRTLAILGGGPIGLEAAAAAAANGFEVRVFERGEVGASVSLWGHVRMFTPWKMNRSALGARLAKEAGAFAPDPEVCPTGDELVAQYLLPLASHPLLRGRIETGSRVLSIAREGLLKGDLLGRPERRSRPFRLLVERDGNEKVFHADAVIDATGTYGTPRWLGSGGSPAVGERHAFITRHVPDVLGRDQVTYAGERVLVIGAGLSAATLVRDLAALANTARETEIVWAVRGEAREGGPIPPIAADPLPERVKLTREANALATGGSPSVKLRTGVTVQSIQRERDGERVGLLGTNASASVEHFDRVVALVGYRPDRSLWEELQVHECYASGGPMKLAAALLGSTGGDCLTQTSHGPESLASPEPDFVVIGAKSYGRNPQFLLRLGHEQVRDALHLLTGGQSQLVLD